MKHFNGLREDLRKWFSKTDPEGGWKRINSKGEAIGPCAREPGEPKPKCMSNEKRAKLSKKERASAVRAKRKHDPVADRSGKGGKPVNVSNFGKGKLGEDMEHLEEKNAPTNPKLWAQAKSMAKSKFDVYPSAYANGWASKWYKSKGGGWKSVDENHVAIAMGKEMDDEGSMIMNQLDIIEEAVSKMRESIKDPKMQVPAWVQSKVTLAADYMDTVSHYMSSKNEESVNEASSAAQQAAIAMNKKMQKLDKLPKQPKGDYERKVDKYLKKKYKKEETIFEKKGSETDNEPFISPENTSSSPMERTKKLAFRAMKKVKNEMLGKTGTSE